MISEKKVYSFLEKIADFKDYINTQRRSGKTLSDSQKGMINDALEWLLKTIEEN